EPDRAADERSAQRIENRPVDLKVDRAILDALCRTFVGRAVGLGTLAVAVSEAPETVEDVYEPFLLQCGLIERPRRGRAAAAAGLPHIGLPAPTGPGPAPDALWR